MKLDTLLAQLGNRSDALTGSVATPIHLSTAFGHTDIKGIAKDQFDYIRTKNPTRTVLEEGIARLEGAHAGFACASGMAAIQLVMSLFAAPDEWLISSDVYGGTYRLLDYVYQHQHGIKPVYVDTASIDAMKQALTPQTKAIFIETPSNPLMQECDLTAVIDFAKAHHLCVIVDNTFLTPILSRPLSFGADIVVHSATKYLAGHNDVLAGLVVASDPKICEKLAYIQNGAGAVLSPFDSYMLIRGLKTLSLRMKKHEQNAKEMAAFLKTCPDVSEVLYPNKGGMLSFRLKEEKWVIPFLKALKLITFAESLGGTESFITYPATQTHMDIPEAERQARGICNRLLRFSVGIEDVVDLQEDFEQALRIAKS